MSNGPAGPPEPPRRPPALADLRSVRTWAELRSQGKPGASAFDEAGIAADVLVVLEANDVMAEWCSVAEAEVAALRARLDAAQSHVDDLHEHRGLSETAALRITHALNGKKGPVQR